MPIYERDVTQLGEITQVEPPAASGGFVDTLSAAFQIENSVGSLLSKGSAPGEYPKHSYGTIAQRIDNEESDYDPLTDIAGYEEYAVSFINDTKERADWRKAAIDKQRQARADIEAAGFPGVAASFAAGVLDPIQWVTFGPGKSLLYGGAVRAAGKTSVAAMGGAALSELSLQSTQETRTTEESAYAIGGAGLLGGILGAAGSVLTKSEFDALAKTVAREAEDTPSLQAGKARDAGAAATQGTTMAEESLVSIGGFEKTAKVNPYGRVIQSSSLKARQVVQDLAENNYYLEKNNAYKPTGQAVETFLKAYNALTGLASENLDNQFLAYRNSTSTELTGRAVVAAKDLMGTGKREGKLSYTQFKLEVGKAMRRGDKSDIPEVAAAAKYYRQNVFEPIKKKAIEIGMLPEDVDVKFADSYLTRVYNFEKMQAQPDKFKQIIKDWARSQAKDLPDPEELSMRIKEQSEAIEGLTARFNDAKSITVKQGDEIKRLRQLKADAESEIKLVPEGRMQAKRKAGLIKEAGTIKGKIKDIQVKLSKAVKERDAIKKELSENKKSYRESRSDYKKSQKLNQSGYVDNLADDIYDNIVGSPGGLVPKNVIPEGSPFKSRTLPISDRALEDFLESDIETVAEYYTRSTAPQIEITLKYGDRDMKAVIDDIRADFNQMIKDNPKRATKLNDELERNIKDIEAMRDQLYGVYNQPADPTSFWMRANKTTRELQFLSKLGGMMLSSIPDMARPVMVHGLRNNAKMFAALAKNPAKFKMAVSEAKKNAAIFEMIQSTRANSMADIGDMYKQGTKFEKAVHGMTSTFGAVSLMSPWNQTIKQWAGMISSDFVMRESVNLANGKISKSARRKLAQLGVGKADAKGIAEQVNRHSDKGDIWLVNSQAWDDQDFLKVFRAAVTKDTDSMIVTPGVGDVPLWMRTPTGKLIGQFKSFVFASHNRMLLAGLQQRDAAFYTGLMLSMGLGAMTYGVKELARGEEVPDDPVNTLKEAVNYSGVFALLSETNGIVEKATRGNVGFSALLGTPPMSRYASRNFTGAILGPTLGSIEDIGTTLGGIGMQIGDEPEGFTQRDLRALRRLLPYQNLWYTRNLLNYVEDQTGEIMGLQQ